MAALRSGAASIIRVVASARRLISWRIWRSSCRIDASDVAAGFRGSELPTLGLPWPLPAAAGFLLGLAAGRLGVRLALAGLGSRLDATGFFAIGALTLAF